MSGSAATRSLDERFPPHVLREYSLVADGERGALIGPRGDVTWMCVPRWDSPSVFGQLVGAGGLYAITPRGRFVWGGYYEQASLIWRSRWITEAGVIECREALSYPGEPHRAVLLRSIQPVDCTAEMDIVLEPRAGYGETRPRRGRNENGVWTATLGDLQLRWSGAAHLEAVSGGWYGLLTVEPGRHHDLVLELSDQTLPDALPDPRELWEATQAAWRDDVPSIDACLDPDGARQSYAVLRGLTSRTGAMVAAATTSLPERADTGRSYDYRYAWIRDQCFTGQSVAAAEPLPLLDDAVRFVTERLLDDGDRMMPAYTTSGDRVPDEQRLDVPGYPGGTDVIGNHVNEQFQLDAFGEALSLLATAARHDRLDVPGWRAAQVAADAVARRWREPDAGIWELDNAPWTHSRLAAAAGLRAIASAAPPGRESGDWLALADLIVAETAANAVHPNGYWQRTPDDDGLDASLLLIGLRGGVPHDDPRTIATLRAYLRELTDRGYGYRFRVGGQKLGQAEGAFQLCGFLTAMALHQQGDHDEALRWYERTRAACGPPQLFSEEYDAIQNQMRGNLPQAFVHGYMIEASTRLAAEPRVPSGANPSGSSSTP